MQHAHWLIFLCLPFFSIGQSSLQNIEKSYRLKDYTQVIETSADHSIDKIVKEDKFSNSVLQTEDLESGKIYWGRIEWSDEIRESNITNDWMLKFSTSISRVEVYLEQDGNYQKVYTSGTLVPINQKPFVTSKVEGNIIPISLGLDASRFIYFRFLSTQTNIRPNISIELIPEQTFYRKREQGIRGQYLFVGIVMMIVFLNVFQYFESRDSAFIYYTIYLIAVLLFIMYTRGELSAFLEPRFFPNYPQYIYFFKSTIIYVGIVAYWAFIREYFNLSEWLPKWSKIFKILSFLAIPLLLLEYLTLIVYGFSPGVSDSLSLGYTSIFILVNAVFLVPIFKRGDIQGRFIAVGVAALVFGFALLLIARLSSIDFSTISMQLGIIVELSSFAFGLIYRGRQLEEEKRQAEFALEKSKILQAKQEENAIRMQKVFDFQNRFYANFTHEFRSPLTVISGVTQMLKGHKREKELLKQNSESLLELVNNVLEVGKVQSGNFILRPQKVNLTNYLHKQLKHFQAVADVKQINIQTNLPNSKLYYSVDLPAFRLIISNLLENAVKYSHEKGSVFFSVLEHENTGIKIEIKDEGIGISEEELSLIFERYYQSEAHRQTGTGLGLSVVKELVDLMNGTIKVESEIGRGTTFKIKLPLKKQEEEAFISTTQTLAKDESIEELARVLVVDDHKDILEYIEALLGEEFKLILAEDGIDALEKSFQFIPDIVISDINMPGLDGLKLCNKLKTDRRTDHIPVILLTANTTHQNRLQGLNEGADVYLNKPFDADELKIRIRQLLKLRTTLQESYQGDNQLVETKNEPSVATEGVFLTNLKKLVIGRIDDENLQTDDLCKAANLGYTQTYRKLKALTGQTPVQFIRAIRMAEAYQLLKTKDLSVADVAYRVGFNDPNYFSRTFTQAYGISPKKMKNS